MAEVSGSSFGVGFETGYLLGATEKKIVLFFRQDAEKATSLIITGIVHPNCTVVPYSRVEELETRVRTNLARWQPTESLRDERGTDDSSPASYSYIVPFPQVYGATNPLHRRAWLNLPEERESCPSPCTRHPNSALLPELIPQGLFLVSRSYYNFLVTRTAVTRSKWK